MRTARAAIILSLTLFGSCIPILSQQRVGFVLEIQGDWAGSDHEPLRVGQSLQGGLVLNSTTAADGDHIVIANLRGDIVKTIRCKSRICRECTEAGGCYDPIHALPSAPEASGTVSTVLNAVIELLSAKPERYSVHRVRGVENSRTEVARLEDDRLDLGSLLEGEEAGTYEFQFISLSKGSQPLNSRTLHGQGTWNPGGKQQTITISGIEPGLYEVRYDHGPTTGNAWVLLCADPKFKDAAADFQGFRQQTEAWDKSVTDNTRQRYRRAYLEYLDRQIVRSGH